MRSLTRSLTDMPPDVERVEPLLGWMRQHWGCSCEVVEVVMAHHADGTGGLRIIHEEECRVVLARTRASN